MKLSLSNQNMVKCVSVAFIACCITAGLVRAQAPDMVLPPPRPTPTPPRKPTPVPTRTPVQPRPQNIEVRVQVTGKNRSGTVTGYLVKHSNEYSALTQPSNLRGSLLASRGENYSPKSGRCLLVPLRRVAEILDVGWGLKDEESGNPSAYLWRDDLEEKGVSCYRIPSTGAMYYVHFNDFSQFAVDKQIGPKLYELEDQRRAEPTPAPKSTRTQVSAWPVKVKVKGIGGVKTLGGLKTPNGMCWVLAKESLDIVNITLKVSAADGSSGSSQSDNRVTELHWSAANLLLELSAGFSAPSLRKFEVLSLGSRTYLPVRWFDYFAGVALYEDPGCYCTITDRRLYRPIQVKVNGSNFTTIFDFKDGSDRLMMPLKNLYRALGAEVKAISGTGEETNWQARWGQGKPIGFKDNIWGPVNDTAKQSPVHAEVRWRPNPATIELEYETTGALKVIGEIGGADVWVKAKDATAWLGGTPKGKTNETIKGLATGEYDVRIEKRGYLPSAGKITIEMGRTSTLKAPFTSRNVTVKSNGKQVSSVPWAEDAQGNWIMPVRVLYEALGYSVELSNGVTFGGNLSWAAKRGSSTKYFSQSATEQVQEVAEKVKAEIKWEDEANMVVNFVFVGVGNLIIDSTPSFADLFIDGQPKGFAYQTVSDLPEGPHQVRITYKRYKEFNKTVQISTGDNKLKAELERLDVKLRLNGITKATVPYERDLFERPVVEKRVLYTALGAEVRYETLNPGNLPANLLRCIAQRGRKTVRFMADEKENVIAGADFWGVQARWDPDTNIVDFID